MISPDGQARSFAVLISSISEPMILFGHLLISSILRMLYVLQVIAFVNFFGEVVKVNSPYLP
jgi:hypothetical protein